MAEQVKYIKISNKDANNINSALPLKYITEITIPYSNGNEVKYPVISVTPGPGFHLYGVGPVNNGTPDSSDLNTLNYIFSASFDPLPFTQDIGQGYSIPANYSTNPNPLSFLNSVIDNQNFYTTTIRRFAHNPNAQPVPASTTINSYQIKTYPQKDLDVLLQGTVSDDGSGGNDWVLGIGFGPSVNFLEQNVTLLDNLTASISPGSSGLPFTIIGTIPSQSIKPGDFIFPYASNPFSLNQCDAEGMAFGAGTHFRITSTAATVNNIEDVILEPYLTSEFGGSDYDILFNNVELYRENPFLQDIDFSTNPLIPVNNNLIISGTAVRGTVPESYYTSLAQTNIRYNGVKNQSSDVNIYNPQAGFTDFGNPINIGTYGQTPSVSELSTTIYEFEWGGGTNPEIQGYGAVKMGKILQASSKDLVRIVDPSKNNELKSIKLQFPIPIEPSKFSEWNRNSTELLSVNDYSIALNENKINDEISMFAYPNQANAGLNPTLPQTTKILTSKFGVPLKSTFMLTSSAFINDFDTAGIFRVRHYNLTGSGVLSYKPYSLSMNYNFFQVGSTSNNRYAAEKVSYVRLYGRESSANSNFSINEVKNDYSPGQNVLNPILINGQQNISQGVTASFGTIQDGLNNGERYFITFYKGFETGFDSDTIVPLQLNDSPLGQKGIAEIIGIAQAPPPSFLPAMYPSDIFLLFKEQLDENIITNPALGASINNNFLINQGVTPGLNLTNNQSGAPALGGSIGSFYNRTATRNPNNGGIPSTNILHLAVRMGLKEGYIKRNLELFPNELGAFSPITGAIPNMTSSLLHLQSDLTQYGSGISAFGRLRSNSNGKIEKLVIEPGSIQIYDGLTQWIGGGQGYSNGEDVDPLKQGIPTRWTLTTTQANTAPIRDMFGSSMSGGPIQFELSPTINSSNIFDVGPEAISVDVSFDISWAGGGVMYYAAGDKFTLNANQIGNPDNNLEITLTSADVNGSTNRGFDIGLGGGGVGFLLWKARASGKNEFVLVQDSVTGGVGAGAFTSKYTPEFLTTDFKSITSEYGDNNPS